MLEAAHKAPRRATNSQQGGLASCSLFPWCYAPIASADFGAGFGAGLAAGDDGRNRWSHTSNSTRIAPSVLADLAPSARQSEYVLGVTEAHATTTMLRAAHINLALVIS